MTHAEPTPPSLAPGEPPALAALTSLRFFAALYVVLFHYAPEQSVLHRICAYASVSVTFFFVISGFILVYSYANKLDAGAYRSFWLARFMRIYPLYLLAWILMAPYAIFIAPRLPAFHVFHPLPAALTTISLVQAWIPGYAIAWNIPAWSVSAEMVFYMSFPFLVAFILRRRSKSYVLALLACVAIRGAIVAWIAHACPALLDPNITFESFVQQRVFFTSPLYSPLFRFPEFLFGVYLGFAFIRLPRPSPRVMQIAAGFAIALVIIVPTQFPSSWALDFYHREVLAPAVLLPFCGLLIYCVATARGPLIRVLAFRPLVWGGELTYAIYVLQAPVAVWFNIFFGKRISEDRLFRQPGMLWVYLFVLIAVSAMAYRYIELPVRTWAKSRLKLRRPAVAVSS